MHEFTRFIVETATRRPIALYRRFCWGRVYAGWCLFRVSLSIEAP